MLRKPGCNGDFISRILVRVTLTCAFLLVPLSAFPSNEIEGQWSINANNYLGKIEFRGTGSGWTGRVWFDVHGVWEELQNISFDPGSGRVEFLRPGPNQRYTGTISGVAIAGTFTSGGGSYSWRAERLN